MGRGIAASILLVFVLSACSSGTDDGPPSTPDGTERIVELIATAGPAEEVLRQWVAEHLSQSFVPRCAEAARPGDVGKLCANLIAERDGRLAYQLGPTFSSPTRLFILEQQGGAWAVLSDETYSGELGSSHGRWPLARASWWPSTPSASKYGINPDSAAYP